MPVARAQSAVCIHHITSPGFEGSKRRLKAWEKHCTSGPRRYGVEMDDCAACHDVVLLLSIVLGYAISRVFISEITGRIIERESAVAEEERGR